MDRNASFFIMAIICIMATVALYVDLYCTVRDARNEEIRLDRLEEENFLKESMEERLEKRFVNVGYVEKEGGKERYIIPIFDETSSDRLFFDETGILAAPGIYYYEYEWRSDGAYVVEARKLSEYVVDARLDKLSEDLSIAKLRFSEEGIVSLDVSTKYLKEQELEILKLFGQLNKNVEVRLLMKDEMLTIGNVLGEDENPCEEIKTVEENSVQGTTEVGSAAVKNPYEERKLAEENSAKKNVCVNVGYIEKEGSKESYIIPLLDGGSSERLFFDETGILSAPGIYYYKYEERSDGAYVVAAKELSDYVVDASLKEKFINTKDDRDNNFWIFKNNVIELEEASISKDLNEQELEVLYLSRRERKYVKIRLIMRDGKLMIDKVFTTKDEILNQSSI